MTEAANKLPRPRSSQLALTTRERLPALIVGAGIGGLAAALALSHQGLAVRVLEQSEANTDGGAGIQLAPNAFSACEALGIAESSSRRAVAADSALILDATDHSRLVQISLGAAFRARFGHPYASLHRSDLYAALLEAVQGCGNIELLRSVRVVHVRQDERSVTLVDSQDRTYTGSIAIGSDGVRSVIRTRLVGDLPRLSGDVVYRSIIGRRQFPRQLQTNGPVLWSGPGCHLIHYPIRAGEQFNLVFACKSTGQERWGVSEGNPEELSGHFSTMVGPPPELMDLLKSKPRWTLADREPIARWTFGRVTLSGDAAHPMLPHIAQGACMALEDAVTLGQAVRLSHSDLPAALELYNRARHPRTTRAVLSARQLGRLYHLEQADRMMRNQIWRQQTQEQLYEALDWLYGWKPEQCLVLG